MADRKRDRLDEVYRHDPRVEPWCGTAHGVLLAVSTYDHTKASSGVTELRNGLKTITGEFGWLDRRTWQTLRPVLAAA